MMSLEAIRAHSDEAARVASHEKKTPFVFWNGDEVAREARSLPFLGSYVPFGWERAKTYFVDSSGMGREDEPALTYSTFVEKVQKDIRSGFGYGYAIVEAGPFQVKIGAFRKVE